ncbi:hypothetical protein O7634_17725 [Micromonospora sp. WMMD1120]|uniref:hypothetical protein n=1 Tax=Micromonospora sp. WMMD1120 TaxID=3016106 RepID=UPI0024160185|nr:hypothetical protein [Micromonospora sp. WMMD1120]MDG4808594.1 hypothetical protein [Micromonospora sp. WMMD1120]
MLRDVRSVRVLAYFPCQLSTRSGPAGAVPAGWSVTDGLDDLALQPYGQRLLDELLGSMPRPTMHISGGPELLRVAGEEVDASLLPTSEAGAWQVVSARISVWNVDCGLLCVTYQLPDGIVGGVDDLVVEVAAPVQRMVPAVTRLLRAVLPAPDGADEVFVLWANTTFAVQVDPDCEPARRRAIAEVFTPDGVDCTPDGMRDGVLRVGTHTTAVVSHFGSRPAALLARLTGVHHVCWAAALRYDAVLSAELSQIEPGRAGLSMSALEEQAKRILSGYHRIRLFRLGYSSVEAHLDAAGGTVWNALEQQWKFRLVLTVLDERLDFVRTLHQQLVGRLQDRRSRLLNELVLAFTFLNIFAIVLAALTFVALPSLDVGLLAATIAVVMLVVNLSAYLVFRRQINDPGRHAGAPTDA